MDTIFQILKPKTKKPEISLDYIDGSSERDEMKVGKTSPLIQMSEHTWKDDAISSFQLKYGDEMLPELDIVIKDKNGIIENNISNKIDTLDVFIGADNVDFEPIKMTFLITESEKLDNGEYSLSCEVFIKNIDTKLIKNYSGSSFEVLLELCKELGIGFASNITSTNDNQTWLRVSQSTKEFMSEIALHSWNSEKGCIKIWIDPYYCLNVFDINESIKVEKEEFDKTSEVNLSKSFNDHKIPVLADMILSNHKIKVGTANYIDKYKETDKRGSIEKEIGFERLIKTHDIDNNIYHEYVVQHEIESEKIERSGDNLRSTYVGFTSINTHRNYNHARVQNIINKMVYESKGLVITQNNLNAALYCGIKIPVLLINNNQNNSTMSGDQNESGMNEQISGDYIISEITFSYSKKVYSTISNLFFVKN